MRTVGSELLTYAEYFDLALVPTNQLRASGNFAARTIGAKHKAPLRRFPNAIR